MGSTWQQWEPRAGQPPSPGVWELPGPCRVSPEPALSKQGCLRAVHGAWLFFFVFITSIYHFYRNNRNINQGNSLLKVPGRVTRLRLTRSWGWGQGWRVEGAGRPVTEAGAGKGLQDSARLTEQRLSHSSHSRGWWAGPPSQEEPRSALRAAHLPLELAFLGSRTRGLWSSGHGPPGL